MLTGRVGSGIAAELGSMVVTDQINALRALGTDPIRKLVVPRVLAGVMMAPVLTVVADFVGIVGGWMVARYQLQVRRVLVVGRQALTRDLWMGSLPFVLGFVIVTVACHVGLRTRARRQPKATRSRSSPGPSMIAGLFHRILIPLMYTSHWGMSSSQSEEEQAGASTRSARSRSTTCAFR
jgi:ABC-type transporter Mla maintaining outer membrane lipid asymmetry permease subunit MlaE